MLKVALFEDQPEYIENLDVSIRDHDLVAEAFTLGEAFRTLERMSLHEIDVDVILLDGTLSRGKEEAVFTHELPPVEAPKAKKGLFGRIKTPKPQIVTVREFEEKYRGPGGHARAIMDVLNIIDIHPITIGISGNSMSEYGIQVDHDLTKSNSNRLGQLLTSIEVDL